MAKNSQQSKKGEKIEVKVKKQGKYTEEPLPYAKKQKYYSTVAKIVE